MSIIHGQTCIATWEFICTYINFGTGNSIMKCKFKKSQNLTPSRGQFRLQNTLKICEISIIRKLVFKLINSIMKFIVWKFQNLKNKNRNQFLLLWRTIDPIFLYKFASPTMEHPMGSPTSCDVMWVIFVPSTLK